MKVIYLSLVGVGSGFSASVYNPVVVDELGLPMLTHTFSAVSLMTAFLYGVMGPVAGEKAWLHLGVWLHKGEVV